MDYKVTLDVRLVVVADNEEEAKDIALDAMFTVHREHANLRSVIVDDVEEINSHGK